METLELKKARNERWQILGRRLRRFYANLVNESESKAEALLSRVEEMFSAESALPLADPT